MRWIFDSVSSAIDWLAAHYQNWNDDRIVRVGQAVIIALEAVQAARRDVRRVSQRLDRLEEVMTNLKKTDAAAAAAADDDGITWKRSGSGDWIKISG